jgi:O-methyltransferase
MRVVSSENAEQLLDAQAQLAAARDPQAPGPAAGSLRDAYLGLLKLCLCDLAGSSTTSVGAMPGGTVLAREIAGDERRLRVAGMDWPLHGLTMVGLERLDDLQSCIETVVADGVEGDVIEAGAWRGGAAMLLRATLDTLGDERDVWVADSFQGFPPDVPPDDGSLDLRAFEFLAVPEAEVRASFARLGLDRGVRFLPGFFRDTLGGLAGARWALVRLDADSYTATRDALAVLYPGLAAGAYLVVDDYGSFEGCRCAVDEFREEHGIDEPIERVDRTCVRWRRRSAGPVPAAAGPRKPAATPAPAPETPPMPLQVPTARELQLTDQVADLRARLADAEAQIGLRAWLRRRLARGARR